jgi:hypothetical protein
MGVVGSSPSPQPRSPSPTLNDTVKTSYEESTQSCNECSYYIITNDEMDSNTNSSLNSNNDNKSNCRRRSKMKSPLTVTYGPINVKVRQSAAPTLATGRRSKFMKLEGDAALKRELRRKRNREAAKKLKEKRINIEEELKKQVSELESNEHHLLTQIKCLQSYKEYLEIQYIHSLTIQEKLAQTAFSTLKHIERNRRRVPQSVSVYRNDTNIKEEPRPPSPQWQLLFSI